jgi:carnitine O-palmitoyltransferase 1
MIPPALVQGTVPMCMDQYNRAFSLCREPHQEQDKLVQYDATQSRHVVVMFRGRFFKVKVFDEVNGTRLSMYQLYDAYRRIVQSVREDQPSAAEAKLAALTTDNRNTWAQVRTDLLQRNPTNRASLEAIERALFMVTIIDTDLQYTDLTPLSNMYIAHDGKTFWCDKSFTVVVTTGGLMAIHAEHSWADAPVMCHLVEQATGREANDEKSIYAADGSVLPTAEESAALATGRLRTVAPERLQWYVTDALRDAMDSAFERITVSIKDLDLVSNRFTDFGKGKIKLTKCSPDAFVQMALQLAYYRDQGEFTQTYESSMLRLYLEGRTETIRSATYQSCAWVKAMLDSTKTSTERAKLLREACANHQRNTALAMTGKGVDRHLFALYVVAVGTMTDSPFLISTLRRGWKLSTSQTPVGLGTSWKDKKHLDTHPRTLGGFGPVRDDGYGVAYAISNENVIVFHVSSKRSCPATDSTRLYGEIYKAMNEMLALFEAEINAKTKPAITAAVAAPAAAAVQA